MNVIHEEIFLACSLRFSHWAELIEVDGQLTSEGRPPSAIRKLITRNLEVLNG